MNDNKEVWVSFKYEKLPNFCYWCGLISHDGKDCEVWLAKKNAEKTEPHEYGPWLRALPYNSGKTPFIVVPGMGDGLGGEPRSAQRPTKAKSSEMLGKSTGESSVGPDLGKENDADLRNGEKEESRNTGEQIMQTGRDSYNKISEVIISNSNLTSFHTDIADFETQIQEIDSEISKFDKCEAHMDNTLVGASQVPPINEKNLAPSMQTLVNQEQNHHVTENSPTT